MALIHHWKLDETTGTAIADSVGSATGTASNVTLNQAALAQGAGGTAAAFNGTSSSISLPTSVIPNSILLPLSVSVFVKPNASSAFRIFWSVKSGASGQFGRHYLGVAADGSVHAALGDLGNNFYRYTAAGVTTPGQVYMVTLTYNGSGSHNDVLLYINGSAVATTSGGATTLAQAVNPTQQFLGYYGSGGPFWYNGVLDDFRLYDQALAAGDVAALYASLSAPVTVMQGTLPALTLAATDYSGTYLNATWPPLLLTASGVSDAIPAFMEGALPPLQTVASAVAGNALARALPALQVTATGRGLTLGQAVIALTADGVFGGAMASPMTGPWSTTGRTGSSLARALAITPTAAGFSGGRGVPQIAPTWTTAFELGARGDIIGEPLAVSATGVPGVSLEEALPPLVVEVHAGSATEAIEFRLEGETRAGSALARSFPALRLTAAGHMDNTLRAVAPSLSVYGYALERPLEGGQFAVGPLTATAETGAELAAASLRLTVSASGTALWGEVLSGPGLTLPSLRIEASAVTGSLDTAQFELPLTVQAEAQAGAGGQGELPRWQVVATATAGGVGRLAVALPRLGLTTQTTALGLGRAEITLPPLRGVTDRRAVVVQFPAVTLCARAVGGDALSGVYSVNIKHGETTQYTQYPYRHIVSFHGQFYAVGPDGLVRLGPPTVGVTARFRLAPQDFGTFHHKRVPYVYVGSTTPVTLRPFYDSLQAGEFVSEWDRERVRLARGHRSRYFYLECENTLPDFRVERLELLAETLARKTGAA